MDEYRAMCHKINVLDLSKNNEAGLAWYVSIQEPMIKEKHNASDI